MTSGSSPAQGAYRDVRPGPNSGGSPSMMNLVRSSGVMRMLIVKEVFIQIVLSEHILL
jgi:hypothetical protein